MNENSLDENTEVSSLISDPLQSTIQRENSLEIIDEGKTLTITKQESDEEDEKEKYSEYTSDGEEESSVHESQLEYENEEQSLDEEIDKETEKISQENKSKTNSLNSQVSKLPKRLDPKANPIYEVIQTHGESVLSGIQNIPQSSIVKDGESVYPEADDGKSHQAKVISMYQTENQKEIPLNEYPLINLGKYECLEVIGQGTFSIVYKVKRKTDGKIFAAKVVNLNNKDFTDKEKKNILNEVRLLASINHPNIIRYIECYTIDEQSDKSNSGGKMKKKLVIIMEYCDGGNLFQLVEKCIQLKRLVGEEDLWKIIIQVLRGLEHLHQNQIMHRDIKSTNVFLFTDGRVKLADLNIAKYQEEEGAPNLANTQTGTPFYSR